MKRTGGASRRVAMLAVGLGIAGPGSAHLGVLSPFAGFLVFALGGLLGALAALGGVVGLARGGGATAGAALALGGLVAAGVFAPAFSASEFPRINDISTDLRDPPAFEHAKTIPDLAGKDLDYPDAFREIVREHYPDLSSKQIPRSPTGVFEAALREAKARPDWEITHVNREARTFEGVATSRLFRFRDDLVVRVRPEPGGAVVDMRSRSRDGQGDLGVNAARIRAFLATFE